MQKNYGSIDEMMGHISTDTNTMQRLLRHQTEMRKLANYLMDHHGAQIGKDLTESAVDIAIRLLSEANGDK